MLPSTWITAYQKSGTTWSRFLLCRLLVGPFESSEEVDASVPNIHGGSAHWCAQLKGGGARLATHKRYDTLTERYGDCVDGFVHVVRHPADVLVSEARFFCLNHAGAIARKEGEVTPERLDQVFRDYLTVMLANGESARHKHIGMGSWATHARTWLDARDAHPHVLLRYEDLKRQPAVEVRRLADFFGLDCTDAEIDAVVADCSAERMRAIQEREVSDKVVGTLYREHMQTGYDLGLRFVGRAEVGRGSQLGAASLARIEALFGPVMERLGYATDPSAPLQPRPELRQDRPLPDEVCELA